MPNDEENLIVGSIAVSQAFISEEELQNYLKLQTNSSKSLLDILIDQKRINEEQKKTILMMMNKIASDRKVISEERQKDISKSKIIISKNFTTPDNVKECLELQYNLMSQGKFRKLTDLLLEKKYISQDIAVELNKLQYLLSLVCKKCEKTYSILSAGTAKYTCPHCKSILEPADNVSKKPAGIDPFICKRIGGYEIFELINKGNVGNVYKALHIAPNKMVAIKIVDISLKSREFIQRIIREAQLLAKIKHPNVVSVLNTTREGNYYLITMQLVSEKTLADRMNIAQLKDPFTLPEILKIAKTISSGLAAIHENNIIHRDLKPTNIAISKDFSAKIIDFGLAINIDKDNADENYLADTPQYISPELWMGKPATIQSDLYALGIILYYIATNTKPFDGKTLKEIREKHLKYIPPSPAEINKDIPLTLSSVIKKLIPKNPQERYKNANELIKDIEKIEGGSQPDSMRNFADSVICNFCDAKNPLDAKRCRVCGEPLKKTEDKELDIVAGKGEFRCSKCKGFVEIGSRACPKCGSRVCVICQKAIAVIDDRCLACVDTDMIKKIEDSNDTN